MNTDGWTEEEIIKLIGGNILRVMEKNEEVRKTFERRWKKQKRAHFRSPEIYEIRLYPKKV